jgi:hypothetical protein
MAELTIITNNVPREVVEAYELPIEVRDEFDYLDWTNIEMGWDDRQFVQYKDQWYDLGDFISTNAPGLDAFSEWDAYVSDSFFSGVLVKYADLEHVIMGRYYS